MILESKSGRQGVSKVGFRTESIEQIKLPKKSGLKDYGIDSCCFSAASGSAFLIFAALETGLGIDGFSM